MRNYALLRGGKPTKVGGLHGGRDACLVNCKGIMEAPVGCILRKKRRRIAADRSGQKRMEVDRSRSPEVGEQQRWPPDAPNRKE